MPRFSVPAPLLFHGIEQFGMRRNSSAAAHELDTGPLEHIDLPADPAQERSREQARHGATDDNSTARARH